MLITGRDSNGCVAPLSLGAAAIVASEKLLVQPPQQLTKRLNPLAAFSGNVMTVSSNTIVARTYRASGLGRLFGCRVTATKAMLRRQVTVSAY